MPDITPNVFDTISQSYYELTAAEKKLVELYRKALAKGVAICPGDPFYEYKRNVSSFRVNYSNSTDEAIEKGVKILGEACKEMMNA